MRITLFFIVLGYLFSSLDLQAKTYLQLVDKLDRPEDGYCLDVAGNGRYVRFDMPMNTHNCKLDAVYDDEVVEWRDDGTLYFPAYQGCVTVMGLNEYALEYNALMLKPCHENSPFLNATQFQTFIQNDKGQAQLKGSELCIAAGGKSKVTYRKLHKWRSLYMQACDRAPLERSRWELLRVE